MPLIDMDSSLRQKLIAACGEMGIQISDMIADGKWHRSDLTNDRRGQSDASVKIFTDGRGAIIRNWKTGEQRIIFSERDEYMESTSDMQRKSDPALANHNQVARVEDVGISDVADKAKEIWEACTTASPDHPYLTCKGISPHGIRQHGENLVIPILTKGKIQSLQFISPDGSKRFLKGGRVSGGYYMIGSQINE